MTSRRKAILKFKFCLFRNSVLILGVILFAMLALFSWAWCNQAGNERAWIMLGGVALTFCYFLQKQQLEETRLMKELITDFNRRYGDMDGTLQGTLRTKCVRPALLLSPRQQQTLVDYFNLCAEEYLFYDLGYVEPRVWRAWKNGMKAYAKDKRIQELWKNEKESKSYYDFDFPPPSEGDRGEPSI